MQGDKASVESELCPKLLSLLFLDGKIDIWFSFGLVFLLQYFVKEARLRARSCSTVPKIISLVTIMCFCCIVISRRLISVLNFSLTLLQQLPVCTVSLRREAFIRKTQGSVKIVVAIIFKLRMELFTVEKRFSRMTYFMKSFLSYRKFPNHWNKSTRITIFFNASIQL